MMRPGDRVRLVGGQQIVRVQLVSQELIHVAPSIGGLNAFHPDHLEVVGSVFRIDALLAEQHLRYIELIALSEGDH